MFLVNIYKIDILNILSNRVFWYLILLILFVFVISYVVSAYVPQEVTYQGKLTDQYGVNVPNGNNYNIQIKIYDSLTGGNQLYVQSFTSVSVTNGIFGIRITAPGSVLSGGNRYIQVCLDSQNGSGGNDAVAGCGLNETSTNDTPYDVLFSPRKKLQSSPYAYISRYLGTVSIEGENDGDLVMSGGSLRINGGELTTTNTTLNIFNTTATTINFGGDATSIVMGAVNSGSTTIRNNLIVSGTGNSSIAGNLGIGTTSPSAQLHTTGTVRFANYASGANGAILRTDSSGNLLITNFTGNANDVLLGNGTFGSFNGIGWSLTGNSGTNPSSNFIGTTDNVGLSIRTNNTERIFVTSGGNIGIGTTSPSFRLDVQGTGRFTGVLQLDTQATATNEAVAAGRSINTGTGLTGGGNLTADRTISLTGQALAIHNLGTNGIVVRNGASSFVTRTITGTTNQVIVTDGDGVSGNPVLSLPQDIHTGASPTFNAMTLTSGTTGALTLSGANAGINFSSTTGTKQIITSGTTNLALMPGGGRIGIGTTNPSQALDIVTNDISARIHLTNTDSTATRYPGINIANYMGSAGTGFPVLEMRNYRGNLSAPNYLLNNDSMGYILAQTYNGSSISWTAGIGFIATENHTSTNGGGAIRFFVTPNGTRTVQTAMWIHHNGNVGIGTTNPSQALDIVTNDISARIHLTNTDSTATRYPGINIANYMGSAGTGFPVLEMRNYRGNLSAPNYLLNNDSMGYILAQTYNGSSISWTAGIGFIATENHTSTNGGGAIRFFVTPNGTRTVQTAMWIHHNGNVGIGTTSPTARLHVGGTVRFSSFGAGTLVTDANGNVSVSSDERLKNITGNFTRGLDAIQNIQPISYRWKSETGYDAENIYTGFSAQNIQEFIPEAVGTDPNGYLTLSDRTILATIVNAIKELNEKVESYNKYFKVDAVDENNIFTDKNVRINGTLTIGMVSMRYDEISEELIVEGNLTVNGIFKGKNIIANSVRTKSIIVDSSEKRIGRVTISAGEQEIFVEVEDISNEDYLIISSYDTYIGYTKEIVPGSGFRIRLKSIQSQDITFEYLILREYSK